MSSTLTGEASRTLSHSSSSSADQSLSKKRLKRAGNTWRWLGRYNVLDDQSEEERSYKREGVVRGKIRAVGQVWGYEKLEVGLLVQHD
jgi:hypothetical protein